MHTDWKGKTNTMKNPKKSKKETLIEFSMVVGLKVNIQKPIVFLHTSSKCLEIEI